VSARWRLLFGAMAIAGCQENTEKETAGPGVPPTDAAPAPGEAAADAGNPVPMMAIGRMGRVVTQDDVGPAKESALTKGAVLFVPEERLADLAQGGRFNPADTNALPHATFELEAARLAALGGTAVSVGTDGGFPLTVSPGKQIVCLADIFADHVQGPPYSVVGCTRLEVPGTGSVTVAFGEGGVQARRD